MARTPPIATKIENENLLGYDSYYPVLTSPSEGWRNLYFQGKKCSLRRNYIKCPEPKEVTAPKHKCLHLALTPATITIHKLFLGDSNQSFQPLFAPKSSTCLEYWSDVQTRTCKRRKSQRSAIKPSHAKLDILKKDLSMGKPRLFNCERLQREEITPAVYKRIF